MSAWQVVGRWAWTLGAKGVETEGSKYVWGCWWAPEGKEGGGGQWGDVLAGAWRLGLVWVREGVRRSPSCVVTRAVGCRRGQVAANLQVSRSHQGLCTRVALVQENNRSKQLSRLARPKLQDFHQGNLYSRRACFSEVLVKVWDSGGSETQGNSLKGAFRFLSVTLAENTSLPLRRENSWAPLSEAATPSDAARSPGQSPLPTAATLVTV